MEIEDICRKARAEGLSYGQYVYVHAAELAGKRPVQPHGLPSGVESGEAQENDEKGGG